MDIKSIRKQKGYSQQQVADMMGMHRITYISSEKGKRPRKENEIDLLRKIFNHPLTGSDDTDFFHASPTHDTTQFHHLILYILTKVGIKPNIGKTVLYKLLYFCDFDHYELYGKSITGIEYMRLPRGPAPYGFDFVIEQMKKDNKIIEANQLYMNYHQKKYFPNTEIDETRFTEQEKSVINDVLARLADMNASQISDYSHGDTPRLQTKDMKIIPYDLAKNRHYPYSAQERAQKKLQAQHDVIASGIFTDLNTESNVYEKYRTM